MTHLTLHAAADALAAATGRPHLSISCSPQALPDVIRLQGRLFDRDTVRALAGPGQALVAYGDFVGAALAFSSMEDELRHVPGLHLHLAQPNAQFPRRVMDTRADVAIPLRQAA